MRGITPEVDRRSGESIDRSPQSAKPVRIKRREITLVLTHCCYFEDIERDAMRPLNLIRFQIKKHLMESDFVSLQLKNSQNLKTMAIDL